MASQLRKPLSEVERSTKKTVICVTGAAGYLASSIVARLLAAGHSVRGTVRDPSNAAKNAHLWALPGSKEKLKLFKVREMNMREREERETRMEGFFPHAIFDAPLLDSRGTSSSSRSLSLFPPPRQKKRPTSPTLPRSTRPSRAAPRSSTRPALSS